MSSKWKLTQICPPEAVNQFSEIFKYQIFCGEAEPQIDPRSPTPHTQFGEINY